jgi:hypothetical protein
VREMVNALLRNARRTQGKGAGCRVVYSFRRLFCRTNTQHIKLTPQDLVELERLARSFEILTKREAQPLTSAPPNDVRERRGPAAANARSVSELTGWSSARSTHGFGRDLRPTFANGPESLLSGFSSRSFVACFDPENDIHLNEDAHEYSSHQVP